MKFFLNVSREERKKRFMQRPKNWKFSAADVHERKYWADYMHAFEDAIHAAASKRARGIWLPPTTKGSPALWSPRRSVAARVEVDAES